ncbi:MAG: NUDIX domain-containing protein [Sulfurovum sp.]|nr:NUDIX domain-containing protein [Sulfurovum sp.]
MSSKIQNFQLEPLVNAHFIKTSLARYEQNNQAKTWELIQAHDSVAILIYHRDKEAFIVVKQFRPAVYCNNQNGMTVELCAGIVDKDLSLIEIAKEEIEEECGYAVKVEDMQRITSFHSSVGFAGSKQTLYYAQVDETMKVSEGGGIDSEEIEVITLSISEAKAFIFDESIAKSSGLMFAFMWFFARG